MKIQDRANECIAQGALTNSKRPESFVKGVYPTHLVKGNGCYVWDIEGRQYFDFITGLGSNIIGYANENVNQAIIHRLLNGLTLSLGTDLEIQLAEKLKFLFPFCDLFKFLKTGTEACSAAIRIARASTGRKFILSEGYHGWSDLFVSPTKPGLGISDIHHIYPILQDTYDLMFEQVLHFQGCSHHSGTFSGLEDVAAIIVEPVITDASGERRLWLKKLRELCTEKGILLIFDEVITGFRFPKFCVANYWGIDPDLIVFGKAMGNGMPISGVGGKKKHMNCGEYFVSSTFAGETGSIAAALETIQLLQGRFHLDALWRKGAGWIEEFNLIWPDFIKIDGYPTRGRFVGADLNKALFFQESVRAGMLFGPSWFFNFPLAAKSNITLNLCKDVLWKIKSGSVKLEGEMPKSPFAEKMRSKSS